MEENYSFLRKVEHRLQIMLDLQTHLLPPSEAELRKLALRMGYAERADKPALEAFMSDYRGKTQVNRKILDHLLHDAFSEDEETAAEVDLVLDPDPPRGADRGSAGEISVPRREGGLPEPDGTGRREDPIFIDAALAGIFWRPLPRNCFRRSRPRADPDSTLVNLVTVSDSLGGKGVLWELFSFNPPSLALYVELCAYSPYLSGILTSNPGMIDGLMDSLVLDKLPSRQWLEKTLGELCRAAEDIEPILHSFKNDQQLCVGVRDILGKEDVQAITGALSDIAQTCLRQIAVREYERLVARFGTPQDCRRSPHGRSRAIG